MPQSGLFHRTYGASSKQQQPIGYPKVNQDSVCLLLGKRRYMSPNDAGHQSLRPCYRTRRCGFKVSSHLWCCFKGSKGSKGSKSSKSFSKPPSGTQNKRSNCLFWESGNISRPNDDAVIGQYDLIVERDVTERSARPLNSRASPVL